MKRKIRESDLGPRRRRIARAIMATARRDGLMFDRGWFGYKLNEYDCPEADGSVCAVGAGVLWRSDEPARFSQPQIEFARRYAVSIAFAIGVSDGFEGADFESFNRTRGRREHRSSGGREIVRLTFCEDEIAQISADRPRVGSRADYRSGRLLGRYIAQRTGQELS